MPNELKEKPTHVIQFLLGFDASKIFSPDKVEGMKYILGAKSSEELMEKYVSFIVEKIANTISDQKDLSIARVIWNSFDNFTQQEQIQQQMQQELIKQSAKSSSSTEKTNHNNKDVAEVNTESKNTSKNTVEITEKEDTLINNILRVQFEKESAAEQVETVIIDSSLQTERLAAALKERVGLPIIFKKITGKQFKIITNSKEETINGR